MYFTDQLRFPMQSAVCLHCREYVRQMKLAIGPKPPSMLPRATVWWAWGPQKAIGQVRCRAAGTR